MKKEKRKVDIAENKSICRRDTNNELYEETT